MNILVLIIFVGYICKGGIADSQNMHRFRFSRSWQIIFQSSYTVWKLHNWLKYSLISLSDLKRSLKLQKWKRCYRYHRTKLKCFDLVQSWVVEVRYMYSSHPSISILNTLSTCYIVQGPVLYLGRRVGREMQTRTRMDFILKKIIILNSTS